jgi:hypothetical protein
VIRSLFRHLPGAALALLLLPGAVSAQSLFAQRGLGFIVEPVDARGAALGGVSLGLDARRDRLDEPGGDGRAPGARDPRGLPVRRLQRGPRWPLPRREHRALPSHHGRLPRRRALGALRRLRRLPRSELGRGAAGHADARRRQRLRDRPLHLAGRGGAAPSRRVLRRRPPLSLGLGFDLYTGVNQREYGRVFDGVRAPACCAVEWRYSGVGGTAGAAWSPSEALNLSVAASFGGTLEATPDSAGAPTGRRSAASPFPPSSTSARAGG